MTIAPLRCAIVGLGARGRSFIRRLASWRAVEIAWLIDPLPDRRAAAAEFASGGARPRLGADLDEALADPKVAAVLIATPDFLHARQAIAAFAASKHVFLEKPIATSLDDAGAILAARSRAARVLQLGHVLREAPFFKSIRQAVAAGRIGQALQIRLSDDISALHGASYRRRWHRSSAQSGGLMVHKGCHDLDLICWLLASRPTRVVSFGAAGLFGRDPPATFCQGCSERGACPYVDQGSYEARTLAEAADPRAHGLGRCVFGDGSDLLDRQVVAFELTSGANGVFTLAMGSPLPSDRTISLIGEAGRIEGRFGESAWSLVRTDGHREVWSTPLARAGHAGGDDGILRVFVEACLGPPRDWTPIDDKAALAGLAFSLAAEESRHSASVVVMEP